MTNPTDDLGPTTAWPPATPPTPGVPTPARADDRPVAYDDTSSDTGAAAKQEAAQVKDTATTAAQDVASTAKNQAQNVVGEAQDQARGLMEQAKGEATNQAANQQQRAAGLLSGYASELQGLTSGQPTSGPVTDLARRGGDKAQELSTWLQHHEPGDLLDEVRAFARRRPVAFLIGAAVAGVVVGRATRGFASNAKAEKSAGTAGTGAGADGRSAGAEISGGTDPYGYEQALAYEPVEDVATTPYGDTGRGDVIR